MEAHLLEDIVTGTVVQMPSSGSDSPVPRTKESIDPDITTVVHAIDPQSSQYSCEITVSNCRDDEFDIVDVTPRVPKGVKLNEAVDSAEVELIRRHREISELIGSVITRSLRKSYWQQSKLPYHLGLLVGTVHGWMRPTRRRRYAVEIRCSDDGREALKRFDIDSSSVERKFIEYYLKILDDIEAHEDFQCVRCRNVALKKGQQYKAVYIVSANRGKLTPNYYSMSVDIALRRKEYALSRIAYASWTVPTGYLWTTLIAMATSLIGLAMQLLNFPTEVVGQKPEKSLAAFTATDTVYFKRLWETLKANLPPDQVAYHLSQALLVILTAAIVYNIFDMTSFRDKVGSGRNWRTAVFIGFLCGFLNTKILKALSALLT